MTSLRVLVAHPSGDLYGSDCMVVEAVTGMIGDGMHVLVVLAEPGPLQARLLAAGAEVMVVRALVVRKSLLSVRGLCGGFIRAVGSLGPALHVARRFRPQVVYVSTVTLPSWVALGRLLRIPVLVHVHEAEASAQRAVRSALLAPLWGAQRIVTNSSFAASTICATYPRCASRIRTITNGVATSARTTSMATTGTLRLGYLGRWSPRKGVHVAVGVHSELRKRGISCELHIAGGAFPGYEWYPNRLCNDASTGVTWCGPVDDPAAFLQGIDVALVPSILAEPYGNVAVEALGAARPVVVSRCGGLPEAVHGATAAIQVAAGDVAQWADAVAAIAADRPAFAQAALRDAPHVAARHHPSAYRRALCAEVRGLASLPGRDGT